MQTKTLTHVYYQMGFNGCLSHTIAAPEKMAKAKSLAKLVCIYSQDLVAILRSEDVRTGKILLFAHMDVTPVPCSSLSWSLSALTTIFVSNG